MRIKYQHQKTIVSIEGKGNLLMNQEFNISYLCFNFYDIKA